MKIIIPNSVVKYGGELIVQRFQVGLGIGLVLLITVGKQLVLPRNHILGGDLIDLAFAKIRDDFCFDDMLLGLPGAFFQPCFEIRGVNLNKGFKTHIQITGTLLLELLLPFQCFTAGRKPSLTLLFPFSSPVRVLRDHIPRTAFFVLICWHLLCSFLLRRVFR